MGLTKTNFRMINGSSISPLDFGAVGNGTTDDSSAIQTCINSASEGSVIDFGGLTYICDDVSITTNRLTLQNGKLIAASTADSVSRFNLTADDIVITNMTFYADSLIYTRIGQITADGCNHLRVTNCIFDGARRSGTTQGGDHHLLYENGTKALIQNNVFRGGAYTEQLYILGSTNCVVDGNTFTGNVNTYSGIVTGIYGGGSNNTIISNNVVEDFKTSAITVNGDDCVVTGNWVRDSAEEQGINIGHNSIPANRTLVSDNKISNIIGSGILVAQSEHCNLSGNWIENSNNPGIEILAASNNTLVTNNYIKNITFTADTDADADGIRIRGDSNYATIDGNYLINIDADGISIDTGKSYAITNNTFVNIHNYSGGIAGGRFVVSWTIPDASPEDLVVTNNLHREDASYTGVGCYRGVSVTTSNTNLRATVMNNDFTPVTSTQTAFFDPVNPSFKRVQGNKASNHQMFGSVTVLGGSTSLVVSNDNVRSNSAYPKLTFRDANGISRGVYLSALTDGSFTLTAIAGSDAVVYYEL
jgi:parallel beta-helix repeat protein